MDDPLTPQGSDLRDFPHTPIIRARLFGSEFHAKANDSEWRAGVTLWLKSWDQTPAGSLPTDDVQLCRLAELGRDMAEWLRVKAVALTGWEECSDGRLYHQTVAEVVNKALAAKVAQRERTAKARAAITKKAHSSVTDTVTVSVTDTVTDSKRREGKRREESDSEKHTLSVAEPVGDDAGKTKQPRIDKAEIERVWSEFPRKVGKLKAMPAIAKAIRIVSDERGIEPMQAVDFLVESVRRLSKQSRDKDTQYVPHPITWLNQGRYLDPVGAASAPKPTVNTSPVSSAPKLDAGSVRAERAEMLASVMAESPAMIYMAVERVRSGGLLLPQIRIDDDPSRWSGMVLSVVAESLSKVKQGERIQAVENNLA